jgi:hypothetical protein
MTKVLFVLPPGFSLMKAKDVKVEIDKVKKSRDEQEALILGCLLQCLAHAAAHGDIRLTDRLKEALPRGFFGEGFRQFVYKFSPIRWDESGNIKLLKPEDKGYKPFDIQAAIAADFEKIAPRRNEAILDLARLVKLVKGLGDRIDRAHDDGKIVTVQEHAMRKYVNSLIAVVPPTLSAKEQPRENNDTPEQQLAKTKNNIRKLIPKPKVKAPRKVVTPQPDKVAATG